MRHTKYLAFLSTVILLFPIWALARDKNQHSVDISDSVQVGTTQLKPGTYKVEWQEAGPAVHVKFMHDGKTVATEPATLKTNDSQVTQDDLVFQTTSTNKKELREIDFGHQKEALVFSQRPSGM